MDRTRQAQRGFTLIEVVIALGLLAFTLLGIFSMQFYAMRSNTLSLGSTTALHIAQDQMETLLAQPYDNVITVAPQQVQDAKGDTFTLVTNVADNTPLTDTKTISVTVLWGNNNRQCGVTSVMRRQGA